MQTVRLMDSEVERRTAMGALRSVMTGGSPCRPGLLVFGLLMMVIAGLFAMHVLSMSGPMGHTAPTLTIETEHIAEAVGHNNKNRRQIKHGAFLSQRQSKRGTCPARGMHP